MIVFVLWDSLLCVIHAIYELRAEMVRSFESALLCTHGSVSAVCFHLPWPSREQNPPNLTKHCNSVSAHQKGHWHFGQGLRPSGYLRNLEVACVLTSPTTWSATCKLNAPFHRLVVGIREDLSTLENHTVSWSGDWLSRSLFLATCVPVAFALPNHWKLLKISILRVVLGSPCLNSFAAQQFPVLFLTSCLPSLVSWDSLFYFCCPPLELSFILPVSKMCSYGTNYHLHKE